MTNDRELLQQALDALDEACEIVGNAWAWRDEKGRTAAEALRARLAQPEHEPVAWQDTAKPSELVAAEDWENIDPKWHWMYRPLYTAPPQREWQGLTDDEIRKQYRDSWSLNMMHDFARAIEAKLKERNV